MSVVTDRIEKLIAEVAGYELALTQFPDLKIHKNRWGQERLVSKGANAQATDCQIRHNCGCCSDSPVEVWPYLKMADGTFVFADGIPFVVGEMCYGGEQAYSGWQEKLRIAGLSESVISKVEAFFDANCPDEE